jgi:hypothetical protein
MVLVAERSEQLQQGAPAASTVGEGGSASTSETTGPIRRVRPGLHPGKCQVTRGPASPQLKKKDPVRQAKSRPSRSRSTTLVRSFMRQRPGTLRRISSFMLSLLRPGNSVIISRPIRLWW